ncbi:MAG: hypothetical protein FJ290_30340 [Planctomycetes bacterium]|nr:hypothetical protein [Planctomycetota bacterium]
MRELVFILWLIAVVVVSLRQPFFGALVILAHFVLRDVLIVETYGYFIRNSNFELIYVATIVGVLLTRGGRIGEFMPRSQVDWGMVGFLLAMICSALVNGVRVLDHKYIDLFFKATVLYFLLSRLADTPRRVTIVALTLVLATGYLAYLAWRKYRAGELHIARPYWFSSFHEFGLQVIITLPLAGAMVMGRFRLWVRLLLFASIPLFVLVALRSYSRSSYLGAGLGCVMLLWYYRRRWYVAFAAVPFIVYAILHQPPRVQQRLESIWTHKTPWGTQDTSIAMRIEQMHVAMRIISQRPLLGIGPRQFLLQYGEYAASEELYQETQWRYTMHSVPLLILCEEGLIGFGVFYGLIVFGALRGARSAAIRSRGSPELETVGVVAAGAFMGYLAWCAYSLTTAAMWTINIHGTVALVEAARRVVVAHFRQAAEEPATVPAPAPGWAPSRPSTQVIFP